MDEPPESLAARLAAMELQERGASSPDLLERVSSEQSAGASGRVEPTSPQLPRVEWGTPELARLISNEQPCIITKAALVKPAIRRWKWGYLEKHLGKGPFTVFESEADEEGLARFRYYRSPQITRPDPNDVEISKDYIFKPVMKEHSIDFSDFRECVANAKGTNRRFYLQHMLDCNVSDAMKDDFSAFDLPRVAEAQKIGKFGALTSNMLLTGMQGCVTPVHYDEQMNLLCQISGTKHVIIVEPEEGYRHLHPFPVQHPHDRQGRVDLSSGASRGSTEGLTNVGEGVLSPGEVLFIPAYSWHHIHNLEPETTAITFWFKSPPADLGRAALFPPKGVSRVCVLRNVEKLVVKALGRPAAVHAFMRSLADEVKGCKSVEGSREEENAKHAELRTHLQTLLLKVMAEKDIPLMLSDLAVSRFDVKVAGGLAELEQAEQ
mmetsp:Transcript_27424/g.89768  ORF Transcript_27424/g.89768 Transcript_27424/m.89768 type:complete len:435 (+) Transcript_27424:41-1345(+)